MGRERVQRVAVSRAQSIRDFRRKPGKSVKRERLNTEGTVLQNSHMGFKQLAVVLEIKIP